MQRTGRAPRAGRLVKASLALMVAASLTYAAQVDAMLPSTGDFTVVASLTPGANGGSVEFGTGWEDDIELSIGIDSSGNISVNGEQVGSMGSL